MRHFKYFLFCFITLCWLVEIQATEKKKICLNMIVKNESEVICRCLASVKPIIDYWVIVDTGSNDKTQDIIREFLKDIPGELHERKWIDFAHNRNEALNLAKGKSDYILIIDADEVLALDPNYKVPDLDKDFYYIMTQYGGTRYPRLQLVNNHLDWAWKGVLHETILSDQAKSYGTLLGVTNVVSTDGFRSKDPLKFHKDAQVLENILKVEPDNARYVFYLALSYRDAQEHALALKNFEKRIAMGGWEPEIFWSLLQIGLLQEALEMPEETIVNSYKKAYHYRPTRVEPLYRLALYYRRKGNYAEGYKVAKQGIHMPVPEDALFVENWIYDHGLLSEYSICAYWIEKYTEAYLASQLLLSNPLLPANFVDCTQKNMEWINKKLAEQQNQL